MTPKLIEAAFGMLAKMIPPEEYAKASKALADLALYAKSADERLRKLEAMQSRLDILESIVRSNVDGAEATYAEQTMWMRPGAIDEALAPAIIKPKVIDDR